MGIHQTNYSVAALGGLILGVVCLLHSGCSEDFFDSVVEIEAPSHTPVHAITMIGQMADSGRNDTWYCYVGRTSGVSENTPDSLLADATVTLTINNQNTIALEPDPHYPGIFSMSRIHAVDPFDVKLTVSSPHYPTSTATHRIPALVKIDSMRYAREAAVDPEYGKQDEIVLQWADNPAEKNYYAVRLRKLLRLPGANFVDDYNIALLRNDLFGFFDNLGTLYIDDQSFNGRSDYRLPLQFGSLSQSELNTYEVTIIAELSHITRDRYLYARSLKLQEDAQSNPFAEPVILHTNIENGAGIFSIDRLHSDSLRIN